MTDEQLHEIVIPKEKAVFWLDAQGYWHNVHGKFERKNIIDFFHSAIRRDTDGYYVTQINGKVREKVYFRYEDCALFVFEVIFRSPIQLILNTGRKITLDPTRLVICEDNLYINAEEERIKFNVRSLMDLSPLIEEQNDRYFLRIDAQQYEIRAVDNLESVAAR